MNKKAVISLLAFTPLLMANSPAPMPAIEEYTAIETTITKVEDNTYIFDVTNTGSLHCWFFTGSYSISINGTNVYSAQVINSILFESEMIIPGESKTYEVNILDKYIEETNTVITYAPVYPDSDVVVSNCTIEKGSSDFYYLIKGDVTGKGDYYYQYIVEVSYKGEKYAFSTYSMDSSFYTIKDELDLDQLTIDKVTAFRSTYSTYKNNTTTNWVAGIFVIIFLILLFMPLIIVLIVFIVNKKRSKHKKISE